MFGWGSSSKKLSARDAQIAQFRKAYPSAHETARGQDNVFDISSRTNGGVDFTIRIFIGVSFPAHPPVVYVYMPPGFEYRHPAVNSQTHMIVGIDKLNNWNEQFSLVDVANECLTLGSVLDAYRLAPGHAQAQPSPGYGSSQVQSQQQQQQPYGGGYSRQPPSSSGGSYTNAYLSASQRNIQQQPPSYQEVAIAPVAQGSPLPLPEKERKKSEEFHSVVLDVPTSFPELKTLSENQLERLLNDDVALKSHMGTIGAVSSLRELRESVRSSNLNNAVDAMKLEADITRLTEECVDIQRSLKQQVTEFLEVRQNIDNRYGMKADDVKSKLQAKINECDTKSEELGDQFVQGSLDLQSFLQSYRSLRVDYHSLQIKMNSIY